MSYFPVLLVGLAGVALSAWIAGLRYKGRQVLRVKYDLYQASKAKRPRIHRIKVEPA